MCRPDLEGVTPLPNFGEGIPILYERGKGIINSHKLKSGVGVTAQGVREIHNKAKELYDQTRKDR